MAENKQGHSGQSNRGGSHNNDSQNTKRGNQNANRNNQSPPRSSSSMDDDMRSETGRKSGKNAHGNTRSEMEDSDD